MSGYHNPAIVNEGAGCHREAAGAAEVRHGGRNSQHAGGFEGLGLRGFLVTLDAIVFVEVMHKLEQIPTRFSPHAIVQVQYVGPTLRTNGLQLSPSAQVHACTPYSATISRFSVQSICHCIARMKGWSKAANGVM